MGTDIHMAVEVKGKHGRWFWYQRGNEIYDGRNYDLFAQLADVRNGTGFAGVRTGSGFVPISSPRGLPNDISELLAINANGSGNDDERPTTVYPEDNNEIENDESDGNNPENRYFWLGDHSFSYLTLAELLQYREMIKTMKTVHAGIVGLEEYKVFKKEGKPNGWSGDVGGRIVLKISNDEMDEIIGGQRPRDPEMAYYTSVEWSQGYIETTSSFWGSIDGNGNIVEDGTISQIKEIAKKYNVKDYDVRIVFGFDS